jgi:hypothetical protein
MALFSPLLLSEFLPSANHTYGEKSMLGSNFQRQSLLVCGIVMEMLAIVHPTRAGDVCGAGARCFPVTGNGSPAQYVAQCSGRFPDFVSPSAMVPTKGTLFKLSQNYPISAATTNTPWLDIDFTDGVRGANAYLYALRDYAFEGMIDADFRPEFATARQWFHMPMMNFGPFAREPKRGLTTERTVIGPELGVKPGVAIHNYAIGFYNTVGAVTIGQVWKTDFPDLTKAQFPQGTMTFKLLFSDANASDFAGADILSDAPQWKISTSSGEQDVRLMQMDVGTVDLRSPTGWVFGTFAFDRYATDASPWRRLRPVGLSWGNDYGFTPADARSGKKLKETIISDQIPAYAAQHLGWAGRTNGPIDNPISGCLSCHSTAQDPAPPLTFNNACVSDAQKLFWFRDFTGTESFGGVDSTCNPVNVIPQPHALDFSLQIATSVQNVKQYKDINPCTGASPTGGTALLGTLLKDDGQMHAVELPQDSVEHPRIAR